MDQFQNMAVFIQIAEQQSLRGAARALGISAASISAHLANLERLLGIPLVQRSTRAMSLTEEGRDYLQHCRDILAQMADFEHRLRGVHAQLHGRLRVSAPTTLANHLLIPLLGDFFTRYPSISIELDYATHAFGQTDRNNCDLLLRMGPLEDSGLIARPLGHTSILTVASPAYLVAAGSPATPEELAGHHCIDIAIPDTGRMLPWRFRRGKRRLELQVSGPLVVNTGEGRLHATLAGLGIAQLPTFQVHRELTAGRLLRLLPGWETPTPPIFALYDKAQQRNPRIQALIEHLRAGFPTVEPDLFHTLAEPTDYCSTLDRDAVALRDAQKP